MTDERSERLRRRRKRSEQNTRDRASTQERTNEPEPSSSEQQPVPTEATTDTETDDDATESSQDTSVKDERVGTYMYLPKSQAKELKRLYNVLKAEYEFEFDEEFEKNRHFYPLVIQCGLDSLDGLDASEIKEQLEEI